MLIQSKLPFPIFCARNKKGTDKKKKALILEYAIPTLSAFPNFLCTAKLYKNFYSYKNYFHSRITNFIEKHKYNKVLFYVKYIDFKFSECSSRINIDVLLSMSLKCLFGFHKSILRGVYGIS